MIDWGRIFGPVIRQLWPPEVRFPAGTPVLLYCPERPWHPGFYVLSLPPCNMRILNWLGRLYYLQIRRKRSSEP